MTPRTVFFDVDHTLTKHSTGRRFAEYGHTVGLFQWRELLSLPLFYLRYRLGMVGLRQLRRELAPVAGKPRTELERVAEECFARSIKPDLYREAVALVRRLKDEGVTLGIATTSLDVLIKPLAAYLEIDVVLATSLEYVDGFTTGRTLEEPCFGEEKRRRVLRYLAAADLTPEQCAFYSDSSYDLPLLETVGLSVAVNPDWRLERRARAAGWEIIRFTR